MCSLCVTLKISSASYRVDSKCCTGVNRKHWVLPLKNKKSHFVENTEKKQNISCSQLKLLSVFQDILITTPSPLAQTSASRISFCCCCSCFENFKILGKRAGVLVVVHISGESTM